MYFIGEIDIALVPSQSHMMMGSGFGLENHHDFTFMLSEITHSELYGRSPTCELTKTSQNRISISPGKTVPESNFNMCSAEYLLIHFPIFNRHDLIVKISFLFSIYEFNGYQMYYSGYCFDPYWHFWFVFMCNIFTLRIFIGKSSFTQYYEHGGCQSALQSCQK